MWGEGAMLGAALCHPSTGSYSVGQRGQGHSWKVGPEPSAVIIQAPETSGSSHSGSLSQEHRYGARLGEGVYACSSILLPLTGAKPGPPDPDQPPTSELGDFGQITLFYQIPGASWVALGEVPVKAEGRQGL